MNNQTISNLHFVFMVVFLSLGLVACSKSIDHDPKQGEYGESLLKSKYISDEKILLLNAEGAAKPWLKQTSDGKVGLSFQAYGDQNPYRFIIVVHGHAVSDGDVDVQFFGGIQWGGADGFTPRLYYEEDTSRYSAGETVLLVLSAEPFSVSPNIELNDFFARASLSKRDNFAFDSIELQIWQGEGRHSSSLVKYFFVTCIIAIVLLGVRIITRR